MSSSWHLESRHARLEIGGLRASLDLARPDRGLGPWEGLAPSPCAARLLGIETPSMTGDEHLAPIDRYVHGPDLVVSYGGSRAWPVRVDARWRAEIDGQTVMLALVISVWTDALDSRPELSLVSDVPAADAWRLTGDDSPRFEQLPRDTHGTMDSAGGPGCLLFRSAAEGRSYAEMVHPADFTRGQWNVTPGDPSVYRIVYRLFPQPLEKGVILRARVCGLWLPLAGDKDAAMTRYTSLALAEPPLGA